MSTTNAPRMSATTVQRKVQKEYRIEMSFDLG